MGLTVTLDMPRARRIKKGHYDAFLTGTIAFDSAYASGGELATDISKYFKTLNRVVFDQTGGYNFAWDKTNNKILAYLPSGTPAVSNANESTHTHAAGAITVTGGAIDLATPAYSGTGYATAGQVITTTDNQTMAATNSAAGMWFVPTGLATGVPCLILSNTIVAGAPAVLTCQGIPPVTDAGAYKIVKTLTAATGAATAAGSAHTHTATATGEPGNELGVVDLSALTGVSFIAYGSLA